MLARDPGLADAVAARTADGEGPVDALHGAVEHWCERLAALGGTLAERQTDLRDVFQRAAARLLGVAPPGIPPLAEPSVLLADDLAPADTAGLDPALVLGLVTERGGPTSHTAIIAGQLGIPAVVGAAGALAASPARIALDGTTGETLLDPDDDAAAELVRRAERRRALAGTAQGPGSTRDGHRVAVLANIGGADDARRAVAAGVEGAGLLRTELCFVDRVAAPTVDEQAELYRRVLAELDGRTAVVRVLDAGADKPLAFADPGPQENPALGVRGVRLLRERPELLEAQLAALARARAATGAELRVMAPMVATAEEAEWFVARCRAAGLPSAGAMIEVPAAALRAAEVLAGCDFASIGTNDLAQYLFAADRAEGRLAPLLDGWQPALWQLVDAAVRGAGDVPVGICGEAVGDPLLACVAVGAGVGSVSVSVGRVGLVRAALARHDLATCRRMLAAVLGASSPERAREAVGELADPEIAALAG